MTDECTCVIFHRHRGGRFKGAHVHPEHVEGHPHLKPPRFKAEKATDDNFLMWLIKKSINQIKQEAKK